MTEPDRDYHYHEGILNNHTQKAIQVDGVWFPISTIQHGFEPFWKIGDHIEFMIEEWVLIQNNII